MGFDLNAYGQYDPANPLGAVTGMPAAPKKRGWQSLLYDHMNHSDPNDPYPMQDADKSHAIRQGLLQFAANVSQPNGGNFAAALSKGLLAGSGSVNDSQGEFANDQYRKSIMQRTMASEAANTAQDQAWGGLYGADGQIDHAGEIALQHADPKGYSAIHDKLYPTAKLPEIKYDNSGKPWQVTPTGMVPFAIQGAQAAPQGPMGGGGGMVLNQALDDAVMHQESGGNPSAVSPKGAMGTMQTMPGTLTDPGYGIQPARDHSPGEMQRVGQDYLHTMVGKYGQTGGLAAYNWGPGNWQASLSKYGSPEAALAHAPTETQKYVPSVLARAGGAPAASGGDMPTFGRKGNTAAQEHAPSGYRFTKDGSALEAIPGGPVD
jgi:hypothetical protein